MLSGLQQRSVVNTDMHLLQAGKFAEEFNKRGVPKKVEFIAAYVLELIDRADRPICGVERFVPGEYVKSIQSLC